METESATVRSESEEWYRRGWDAYCEGRPVGSNPHLSCNGRSVERAQWYTGWYDAWRVAKYGRNEGES